MTSENALGNAGYAITGSGGGGSGGQYVFASLDELNNIKSQWAEIRDAILSDGTRLALARSTLHAPADDIMSEGQYLATRGSLDSAIDHNKTMFDYAHAYIDKLNSALEQYTSDDEVNAARVRSVDDH